MKLITIKGLLKNPVNTFDQVMLNFTKADGKKLGLIEYCKETHATNFYQNAPDGTKQNVSFTRCDKVDEHFGQCVLDEDGRPTIDLTEFKEALDAMPHKVLEVSPADFGREMIGEYLDVIGYPSEKKKELVEWLDSEFAMIDKYQKETELWKKEPKEALEMILKDLKEERKKMPQDEEIRKKINWLSELGYPRTTEKERRVNRTDLIDFAEHLGLRKSYRPGNFALGIKKAAAQLNLYRHAQEEGDLDCSQLRAIVAERIANKVPGSAKKRGRTPKSAKAPSPPKKPRRAPKSS